MKHDYHDQTLNFCRYSSVYKVGALNILSRFYVISIKYWDNARGKPLKWIIFSYNICPILQSGAVKINLQLVEDQRSLATPWKLDFLSLKEIIQRYMIMQTPLNLDKVRFKMVPQYWGKLSMKIIFNDSIFSDMTWKCHFPKENDFFLKFSSEYSF